MRERGDSGVEKFQRNIAIFALIIFIFGAFLVGVVVGFTFLAPLAIFNPPNFIQSDTIILSSNTNIILSSSTHLM